MLSISELYGKKIISNDGKVLGDVKGVMLDLEEGNISHLLLNKPEELLRSQNPRRDIQKNSVTYKRVKKVSETIIVGSDLTEK